MACLALLLAVVSPAGAEDTLVAWAPGYPGNTEQAQPTMDAFANKIEAEAGWKKGRLRATYFESADGGTEALESERASVALVPFSFLAHYGDRLGDQKLREELIDWCVDDPWFDNARDDCRFMHCLPVRRGVVVSERVLDGPRSVVIPEARNRMLAQMAVLHQMLGGSS